MRSGAERRRAAAPPADAMRTTRHDAYFLPLMGLLTAAAWLTLWIWSVGPYGRYLDHGDWTRIGVAASICAALGAGATLLPALLYVVGWVLMLAAMMLPTTLPLLEIYRRLARPRPDRGGLLALVVAGYLAAWTVFGLGAHGLDWLLHALIDGNPWLTFNGWIIGAAVLALAGGFQFSALKHRCLDKCRSPLAVVLEHWQGRAHRRQALRLGLAHGLYCVGCCWALMLLMFVVGAGSVGWMMALGAVMAAEKNLPWGGRLSAPIGAVLLGSAALIAARGLTAF